MSPEPIGVQLYTLRDATGDDMVGTLRRVREIGYGAVEFAGWGNADAATVRAALDEHGLDAIAAHVAWERWEGERDGVLRELRTVGCRWAVLPSVPREHLADVDAVRTLAGRLGELGRAAADAGFRFAFHNHAPELAAIDGTTPWHVLVEETAADVVAFELDLYWAAYAAADPAVLLRDAAGRVPLVHAKDIDLPSRVDAPVGEGDLPWPDVVAAAHEAGVEWYIVEQDTPRDAFRDVGAALGNLRRLLAEVQ